MVKSGYRDAHYCQHFLCLYNLMLQWYYRNAPDPPSPRKIKCTDQNHTNFIYYIFMRAFVFCSTLLILLRRLYILLGRPILRDVKEVDPEKIN